MTTMSEIRYASRESEIDTEIDKLIARISRGKYTQQDIDEFNDLVTQRTRLMNPFSSSGGAGRRKFG